MPSNIFVRHFKADATILEDDISPGVRGPRLVMPEVLTNGGSLNAEFVVAKFLVTAGSTMTIGFNVSAKITKNGSATTLVEEGSLWEYEKMCGYDIVIERTTPGSAIAGSITVDPNPWFTAPSPASLGEFDHTGHFVHAGVNLDTSTTISINASGATNLQAHVFIYGKPV
jgi:hypothetical protein